MNGSKADSLPELHHGRRWVAPQQVRKLASLPATQREPKLLLIGQIIHVTSLAFTKWCSMSQYFTGIQTKNTPVEASTCFPVSLRCHVKVMLRDKINLSWNKNCCLTWCFNLSWDIVWIGTSFEYLRHIHVSMRQKTTYSSMTSKSCSLSYFEYNSTS